MLHHMNRASLVTTNDPDFENVTLLLHGDGTNGAQNNTFIDSSTNNFTITRNGNTTQGTFSPYGDNWSNYFDGDGSTTANTDSLSISDNADLSFGSGNFTIECFFYLTATPTTAVRFFNKDDGVSQREYWGYYQSTGIGFAYSTTGSNVVSVDSTSTPAINTWHHLAITRNGSTIDIWVNGVSVASGSIATSIFNSTTNLVIGNNATGTNNRCFPGYISNFRIVKGTALYTSSFTPSTQPLTTTSQGATSTEVELLTSQSNRFIDNSSNAFTITRSGDVSVQRFSPFNPPGEYSTGIIGGSGYFDGTGDYLTVASDSAFTFGTGDYTVEAWAYFNSSASNQNVVDLRPLASSTDQVRIAKNGNLLNLGWGSTDAQISATWVGTGSWVHLVAVRSGTNVAFFVNGTRAGTKTDSTNLTQGAPKIGTFSATTANMNGYIAGVQIVTGTAIYDPTLTSITVPTAPLTAVTNTKLLCNFTNAGIIDYAAMQAPETVGNAQVSTSVKKYGTGSIAFDGTGDWLLMPHSPNQLFGAGAFTIEMWLYLAATGAARGLVAKGTSTTGWLVSINASNQVVFTFGTSTITSTGTISGTTWTHIAVVREGAGTNQTKIYINGTNDGTGTVSTNFNQTNAMYVGADRTGGSALNGNIDELRITNGIARYTANFTPPTVPFANK